MWIESEPADWLMMRYFLCFEPGDPNPEDRHVRAYLRERGLEPKRAWSGERQGIACDVLQFGQCYLGGHLRAIYALRWQGIVTEAVSEMLEGVAEPGAIAPHARADVAWSLAGRVLARAAADPGQADPSRIAIDPAFLREELQKVIAGTDGSSAQPADETKPVKERA